MKTVFTIVFFTFCVACFGQRAYIERYPKGAGLDIAIQYQDTTRRFALNCGFKDVTLLHDSVKIRLIGELLAYTRDTSTVRVPVHQLTNNYMGKGHPVSRRYNIQVEALAFINYVAFSSRAFHYCPFPVLQDTGTGKEISGAGPEMKEIVGLYRRWFDGIKKTGFVNYLQPLEGSHYQWFGSLIGKGYTFREYPKWERFYDCRVVE